MGEVLVDHIRKYIEGEANDAHRSRRWPGKVKPGTSSYAMFSIMDFCPTFARLIGGKIPT